MVGMAAQLKNSVIDTLHFASSIFFSELLSPEQTGIIPSVAETNCVVPHLLGCWVYRSLEGIKTPLLRPPLQKWDGAIPVRDGLLQNISLGQLILK